MTENTVCPNCGTDLKIHTKSLSENKIRIINEYSDSKAVAYCTKCGSGLYQKYKLQILAEQNTLIEKIQNLLDVIPVISTHSPLNWDYDILNIVTGQTTTGMGVLADFSASFADLLGKQATRYNNKLKAGEDLCFAQLRKQTLDLGGNAIIATDIDYSELGGQKGMLMVCMTGTAIRLKNTTVLGVERNEKMNELHPLIERFKHLTIFNIAEI